ncbi:hypothetical protein WICPIJ_000680 [Wickerhamomyces pijperi]|uniref:Uncharacterized protein n=1 Tax=Wickerhamomyces pijperi TaxID=599730 RepID=A0A9P8QD24_WICPI|nr:hypothetical protein WICPIJ_000680 [Wickerhamomyces pijperi]
MFLPSMVLKVNTGSAFKEASRTLIMARSVTSSFRNLARQVENNGLNWLVVRIMYSMISKAPAVSSLANGSNSTEKLITNSSMTSPIISSSKLLDNNNSLDMIAGTSFLTTSTTKGSLIKTFMASAASIWMAKQVLFWKFEYTPSKTLERMALFVKLWLRIEMVSQDLTRKNSKGEVN